jgi:hypothetical protein
VNWDDPANFVKNPHFRGLGWAQLRWMVTTTLLGHWVPLAWLTLGLNYVVGGLDPWGYHLGNLLLHAAGAAVFYFVARRLLAAGFGVAGSGAGDAALGLGAAVAALAWAVHPLRVEVVAWATERRGALSGVLYLLAVLAWLRGVEGGGPVRGRWRAWSLLAFGGALLSKGTAMTLPLTLWILDGYPLRRTGLGWRALVREKAGHLAIAAAAAAVAALSQWQGARVTPVAEYGIEARAALSAYSLVFYPWKTLWATGLSPAYEAPAAVRLGDPRFLGPALVVAALTAGLLAARRRWPAGLAAWAHLAASVAPVSGVVHAGYQLAHDRYSYLPALGLTLLAGAAVTGAVRREGPRPFRPGLAALVLAAAIVAVAGWAGGSWRQSQAWRDSASLWRAALAADPDCALCHNNLGAALLLEGVAGPEQRRLAEAHFRQAIGLRPDRADPYYNLGRLVASEGRLAEAVPSFEAYVARAPGQPEGLRRLGMAYADLGRHADGVRALRAALALWPDARVREELVRALRLEAQALAALGRADEAARRLDEARAVAGP